MANLTMADVAEYFVAFQAKYGFPCTLSLDAIEEILSGIEDDEPDVIVAAMHDAMQPDGEETGSDDRSGEDAEEVTIDTSEGSAYAYAEKMDDKFQADLDVLAEAALQNKRGGAVIMDDLFRLYGEETVCNVWPVPGSEADNGRMLGNRLAAKYKTTIRKEDGTTGEGKVDWYSEFVRYSPRGKELYRQKESLRGIAAKETGPHILEDHKSLIGDAVKLKSAKAALDGKINNAKSAIVRAVQLAQKMAHYNKTTTMGCQISREEDGTPAKSNRLVFIFNTEDRSKFDVLTIGQFLALKNMEEGAKYSSIVGSTTRQRKTPETAKIDRTINTLDVWDETLAAEATFIDKVEEQIGRKEMKAYNALLTRLNAQGSDDLLLSINKIVNFYEAILSKPAYADRLAKLLGDTKKKVA